MACPKEVLLDSEIAYRVVSRTQRRRRRRPDPCSPQPSLARWLAPILKKPCMHTVPLSQQPPHSTLPMHLLPRIKVHPSTKLAPDPTLLLPHLSDQQPVVPERTERPARELEHLLSEVGGPHVPRGEVGSATRDVPAKLGVSLSLVRGMKGRTLRGCDPSRPCRRARRAAVASPLEVERPACSSSAVPAPP